MPFPRNDNDVSALSDVHRMGYRIATVDNFHRTSFAHSRANIGDDGKWVF